MKLYDLPRNSHFRLVRDRTVPPGAAPVTEGEVYWLGNIDGMYSYCKDGAGNVVHVVAWAEVEPIQQQGSMK